MTDHDKLREAIKRVGMVFAGSHVGGYLPSREDILAVCAAAESTLPKTKMVEVWRLEYAQKGDWGFVASCQSFPVEIDALNEGVKLGRVGHACIRVTGPHLQEVPL